jgi:flagellar basal body-associated protein FliL
MTENIVIIIVSAILTALGTITLTLVLMTYNKVDKKIEEHDKRIAKTEILDKMQTTVIRNHRNRIKKLECGQEETDKKIENIEEILKIE